MGYTVLFLLETDQSLLINNVMAVLVFTSHSINTVLHLLFLICHLLRRSFLSETLFVVLWSSWVVFYLLILIALIFLSYYSLVEHFTTRLAIHLASFLLILTGAFIMQNIIRHERMERLESEKKIIFKMRCRTNQIDVLKDECTSL